jgi:hypothetical protein
MTLYKKGFSLKNKSNVFFSSYLSYFYENKRVNSISFKLESIFPYSITSSLP